MQVALTEEWGNPSSLHEWGKRAAFRVEESRWQVAQLINADPDSIVFTAGGTEADQLALLGVARRFPVPQHLIVSTVEHPAVANTATLLEQQGWQLTRLPVTATGQVTPEVLRSAIQPNTALVSIIYGQSEVGTLQPIQTLAQIAQQQGALFHTDAVQVVGHLPVDVQALGVDLLSLSAHKFYGPQGIGALYVRPGTPIQAMGGGGGQEQGLRSGTQAVAAIAGFGVAAHHAKLEVEAEATRLTALRDRLRLQLQTLTELVPTGHPSQRLPHHLSYHLTLPPPISGRTLVKHLNLAGIAISAGSACHSGKLQPSSVLKAMGYSDRQAQAGIRLTLGLHTTTADIDWTVVALQQTLELLQAEFSVLQ